MAHKSSDDFVDALVARDLVGENAPVDAADLEFIRRNPDVLTKLADPLEVKKRYVYLLFAVAVVMGVAAKIFEYTAVFAGNTVLNDILTNVLFSVSIELFGAASVAFLMELAFDRRIKRNQQLLEQLKERSDTA